MEGATSAVIPGSVVDVPLPFFVTAEHMLHTATGYNTWLLSNIDFSPTSGWRPYFLLDPNYFSEHAPQTTINPIRVDRGSCSVTTRTIRSVYKIYLLLENSIATIPFLLQFYRG
ncbi:hypothetical protein Hamer_G031816 [Homarus americanus]|uniref:Uncharacterized protein n=1 Tax=Homarus americanus TaxID=6706 RepID=A0A8J5TI47_HOMAM|nr:hypothetical protein Hamer_G031816 [Homarus americanus]